MPYFESPALYIDFARLPPPQVIEEINYEILLQAYQDQVVAKNPRLASAVRLEQSGTNVILQAEAYAEMMVRARINAAARAVMLPFATGADLDVLGAFYNVERHQIPNLATDPITFVPESDERFRRRIQMAPEAFSTAGSAGAYIFHALASDPTIRDASVMKVDDRGGVKVTIMNSGSDPAPTPSQLDAVTRKLFAPNIKPLTDVVSVAPVKVHETAIVANLTLYPGPDASLVLNDVSKAMDRLRGRIALLGRDLTWSAINAALNQEGVQNVEIVTPTGDIVVGTDGCAWITAAEINVVGTRQE